MQYCLFPITSSSSPLGRFSTFYIVPWNSHKLEDEGGDENLHGYVKIKRCCHFSLVDLSHKVDVKLVLRLPGFLSCRPGFNS